MTTNEMLEKKERFHMIQSFMTRQKVIHEFCSRVNPDLITEVYPLMDPAGPAGKKPEIEAIIHSREDNVQKGVDYVHRIREEKGYSRLAQEGVDFIEITDEKGETIKSSSSLIREHLDRNSGGIFEKKYKEFLEGGDSKFGDLAFDWQEYRDKNYEQWLQES